MIDPQKLGSALFKKSNSDKNILVSINNLDYLNNINPNNNTNIDDASEKTIGNSNLSLQHTEQVNYDSNVSENVLKITNNHFPNLSFNCEDNRTSLENLIDIKSSEIYKIYEFNKEELEKVKIDITFSECNNKTTFLKTKDNTQLAVEFTINYLKKFPEIGYIIKIIKRLLQIFNLNNPFNGKLCLFI